MDHANVEDFLFRLIIMTFLKIYFHERPLLLKMYLTEFHLIFMLLFSLMYIVYVFCSAPPTEGRLFPDLPIFGDWLLVLQSLMSFV